MIRIGEVRSIGEDKDLALVSAVIGDLARAWPITFTENASFPAFKILLSSGDAVAWPDLEFSIPVSALGDLVETVPLPVKEIFESSSSERAVPGVDYFPVASKPSSEQLLALEEAALAAWRLSEIGVR